MSELSEKATRGVAVVARMLGQKTADSLREYATTDQFGAAVSRLALETCYADNWNDDRLSLRERSLLLIAVLIALRQPVELRNHVRLGLVNGLGPADLEEILLQIVPYVGFPAVSTASEAIRSVLKT